MKFAIITHVIHKPHNGKYYAYEPYVREMNLWANYTNEFIIVAPKKEEALQKIDVAYNQEKISFVTIPSFDITNFKNAINALFKIPRILFRIYKAMKSADHIHLRCPSNIGLLGCIVQIFFPKKTKTAKYAGNWDPNSKQPRSYRIQKWILSNTFLTKNIKVLVYGEWENQSKNIVPFFTASYSNNEIESITQKKLNGKIRFLYVGGLIKSKQPMLSVKVVQELNRKGLQVSLDIYGDGEQKNTLDKYIREHNLEEFIHLHGNQSKETVKKAFQESHFLLFISKSEGWPKVVAEAMFWGCLPITSRVSCVPYMLDNNNRGSLVKPNMEEILVELERYFDNPKVYEEKSNLAVKWSQQFTLEKFETSLNEILNE